jgi:hypothetical protein
VTSHLPVMLIDDLPGLSATVETWQSWLAELQATDDFRKASRARRRAGTRRRALSAKPIGARQRRLGQSFGQWRYPANTRSGGTLKAGMVPTRNGAVTSAVLVHLRAEPAHFDWR